MGYFIQVNSNVKLYLEDINEKSDKVILFLHGWPGSHRLFEYQISYFAKKGYRCIGLDQRGFGNSDKPLEGYDYDTLSDDVRFVIEELGLKEINLVGHSTGGAIAVRYMARHNGYAVSKLILCAAAVPSLIRRTGFPYGIKEEVVKDIIKETYSDRPNMLEEFGKIFFHKKVSKAFSEWFLQLGFQASLLATAEIAKTWLNEEKLFCDAREIECETLILHGIYDKVCLFQLAEQQKKLINNSRIIKFEKSGHGLFYDEKNKFNRELEKFLSKHNI